MVLVLLVIVVLGLFFVLKPKHIMLDNLSISAKGEGGTHYFDEIKANLVGGGPPKDGIPSIDHPRYVHASNAKLDDNDVVVGLLQDGAAYAYPRRILYWHEIVNDQIDGENISVTYCPLTGSFIGFKNKTLGVSGKLYNSNLVMYDRATDSTIPQLLAMAIDGSIQGESLEQIPVVVTTWKKWKTIHPNSQVLSFETGFSRDYDRSPYPGYEDALRIWFPVAAKSDKYKSKEVMVVAMLGDTPIAVQKERIRKKKLLSSKVAGMNVETRYDDAAGLNNFCILIWYR